ncbi:hypothetical protein EYF80_001974 [Liparis tanakae]|uniref:Uncharacterized protein n=1 Tax=Liparis tanakae TaxID=230148 RepID=A0A4Z2JCA3_9TELE|nr:hypothetical protein EYF80_001974 [Liparis tanakae]
MRSAEPSITSRAESSMAAAALGSVVEEATPRAAWASLRVPGGQHGVLQLAPQGLDGHVLSSARQVARFLAHWPSCMAAAWSVTVGTDDLVEVTILLPGCGVEKEKEEENN